MPIEPSSKSNPSGCARIRRSNRAENTDLPAKHLEEGPSEREGWQGSGDLGNREEGREGPEERKTLSWWGVDGEGKALPLLCALFLQFLHAGSSTLAGHSISMSGTLRVSMGPGESTRPLKTATAPGTADHVCVCARARARPGLMCCFPRGPLR
eukprot:10041091-Alexandrium_andersonii.AAC.1